MTNADIELCAGRTSINEEQRRESSDASRSPQLQSLHQDGVFDEIEVLNRVADGGSDSTPKCRRPVCIPDVADSLVTVLHVVR